MVIERSDMLIWGILIIGVIGTFFTIWWAGVI